MEKKKLLVVVAHMDDEVYTVGGTIARLVKLGYECKVLVMTESSSAQYDNYEEINEKKLKECMKVKELLGISEYIFANFNDMELADTKLKDLNKPVAEVVKEFKPNIVLTHHYDDIHPDHRATFRAVESACRPASQDFVKKFACFRGMPGSKNFKPNWYVSGITGEKFMAVETYKTELREYPSMRSIAGIDYLDAITGVEIGQYAAEAFEIIYERM